MNKEEYVKTLIRINEQLSILTAEFGLIAGSGCSYLHSLHDFKKIIKAKLIIEPIAVRATRALQTESKKDPKAAILSEDEISAILLKALQKQQYVDLWWDSPNSAFESNNPRDVYTLSPWKVSEYIIKHVRPSI